jgi:3-deoxy-7-phosphoheptulonate synthase
MRVYFEKPRTTVGWKGYINDPFMDDSFRIDIGMEKARDFLLQVNELGLPPAPKRSTRTAPVLRRPHRLDRHRRPHHRIADPPRDVVRPVHPGRLQERTSGDLTVATNAILSASRPHSFLGLNNEGRVAIVRTTGNRHGHIVLRGGESGPNYDTVSIAMAEAAIAKAKLPANIVVDCSHANSSKKPELQPLVMADVVNQIRAGNKSILGVMIESNIEAGNQPIPADLKQLKYGCSVTDGCIGWETTEK